MQKLTPNLHQRFNDRLINLLQQQNISTISDFLRTDSNKLKHLLNIGKMVMRSTGCKLHKNHFYSLFFFSSFNKSDLADLVSMKLEFWKFIGISPINGFQHYKLLERESKCTPTGITRSLSLNFSYFFGCKICRTFITLYFHYYFAVSIIY